MNIYWHGLNCLRLEGKDCTVLLDPFGPESGLKLPRSKVDIVAASSEDAAAEDVSGEPFIIDVPGEYEKMGVFIYGLPWKNDKTGKRSALFRVNMEDISFGHIGTADKPLTSEAMEMLEGVDVLCLPVGNEEGLSVKDAVDIVNDVEPRIVIPMDYAASGVKLKRKGPEAFLKELGLKPETVDKLKLAKKDLPVDQRLVYLIERT